jgi:hypothetical protein
MTTHLTLHHRYSRTIDLLDEDDSALATIDCGVSRPDIPVPDGSLREIVALDVLEHVRDEEQWLAVLAAKLLPGGALTLQVPRQGITGWFDALNMYRYLADIVSHGGDHGEAEPVGWHRHYREDELRALLLAADLHVVKIHAHSLGLAEVPHFARLVKDELIGKDRTAGENAKARRHALDRIDAQIPAGVVSRRWWIRAVKW